METSRSDSESEEYLCTPEDVYFALHNPLLSCSLRVLGSQMGLHPQDLNEIESQTINERLIKLLVKCSERYTLTWPWIVDVLMKPALQQYSVAKEIAERHCGRSSRASDSLTRSLSLSSSTSSCGPLSPVSPMEIVQELEFSIPNAVNEIKHIFLEKLQDLGIQLGLSPSDINMIMQYEFNERHQRLVEMWFARDPDRSWEKLRRATDNIVEYTRKTDIESQLKDFETRFLYLQAAARRELQCKENGVELIEDALDRLPLKIMKENLKYVRDVAKRKKPFKNLKLFFQHLHLHCWNFFEYKVLEILINNYCSDDLKKRMGCYGESIMAFKNQTTISEFISCPISRELVKRATVPARFKKLITVHGDCINPDTHTLSKLDKFRTETAKAVCLHHTLSECAIYIYTIKKGCVVVKWIFPEEFTEGIVELFYSEDGRELRRIHNVEKLLIDKNTVPTVLLLAAMKKENMSKMKALLEDSDPELDINSTDYETDQSVLLFTAKYGNLEIVQLLLEKGADIHKRDKLDRTALIFASHEGHTKIVRLLLQKGADPNQQATEGWTALMLASYRGHVAVVELLQEYNSDMNLTNKFGWTALQYVCLFNKTRFPKAKYGPSERRGEVAKTLLKYGTDIWILDKEGRTPLIAASDGGFVKIVKLLIEKASEFPDDERQKYLDYKNYYSWTAVMVASEKGHAEVVRILIEAGASRSLTKDKDEVSALHIAVENGHTEVVEVLVHKMDKPDLNARDNYGMTPLILATKRRSEQMINVLFHAGADVDAKSKDGDEMTALMFAIKVGSFDVVKMLVEHSANLFAVDSKKQTVLEMAKHSSKEIHEYLSEKYKEAEDRQTKSSATSH